MAEDFKVISQRRWSKGLQATFGIFSEPDGILKRLFNMVYTRRGGLKTVDGSLIFTKRNGALQPADGQILEIDLYSPTTSPRYYMGIQAGIQGSSTGGVTGLTATAGTSAGTFGYATRSSNVTNIIVTGANLGPSRAALPFAMGQITVGGAPDFVGDYEAADMTITGNQFNYADFGPDALDTHVSGTFAPATTIPAGTYTFDITASDGSGGETAGTGSPVNVVVSGGENVIQLAWDAYPGAAGYNLYLVSGPAGQTPGRVNPTVLILVPGTQFSYLGTVNTPGATAPGSGGINQSTLWKMDAPSYTVVLGKLPITAIINQPPPPGGGTGGGASSIVTGATTQGGVIGQICPTPQMVPFENRMMIACGNGYPPQYYADGGAMQQIPNNFTAEYPDWQASVVWNTGDNIVDSVSKGVFTCTQSGESGGTRPTFNNTLNAGTADNTVVWQCTAVNYEGQPLRGAAHAIVYAGSLWLANTYPTTTSDEQDGPSCIKMSDLNNFQSWNPVNVAMVNRDDGDQITGLAQFTIAEAGITPTGSLVVFKNFSTYQVTGVFGATDFSIQQSKSDMGCIASRSIQFLSGFGAICRMTHLGFSLFDGVNDKLISEEIRPFLFGDQNQPDIIPVDWGYVYFSKGSQSSNPPMYICACPVLAAILGGVTIAGGSAGSIYTYFVKVTKLVDIGNGEYVETAITNEAQVTSGTAAVNVTTPAAQTGVRYRVYAGKASSTENMYAEAASFSGVITIASMNPGTPSVGAGALTRVFGYDMVQRTWTVIDLPFPISALKQIRTGGTQPLTICGDWSDAALRRLFAGDTTWDGVPIAWQAEPAEVYQEGGSGKVFYRKVVVRGSSLATVAVKVAANVQGRTGTATVAAQTQLGPQQWDARVDIMKDGENANVNVSGAGQTTLDSVDWYVKPKPAGAPVSAQR